MSHEALFTRPTDLPRDLAIGFYLCAYAFAGMAWDELRHWRLVRLP